MSFPCNSSNGGIFSKKAPEMEPSDSTVGERFRDSTEDLPIKFGISRRMLSETFSDQYNTFPTELQSHADFLHAAYRNLYESETPLAFYRAMCCHRAATLHRLTDHFDYIKNKIWYREGAMFVPDHEDKKSDSVYAYFSNRSFEALNKAVATVWPNLAKDFVHDPNVDRYEEFHHENVSFEPVVELDDAGTPKRPPEKPLTGPGSSGSSRPSIFETNQSQGNRYQDAGVQTQRSPDILYPASNYQDSGTQTLSSSHPQAQSIGTQTPVASTRSIATQTDVSAAPTQPLGPPAATPAAPPTQARPSSTATGRVKKKKKKRGHNWTRRKRKQP